jgi:hypothetical protein
MRTRPRLRARDVFGEALGIYRRHFAIVATVGAVLFAPLVLVQTAAGIAIHDGLTGSGDRAGAIFVWLSVALLMFGSALCAGSIERLVGTEFGHASMSFGDAVRSLPYRRLIGEDLALAILVGTATVIGAIPGLIALTFTCLAGPLVMIEDDTVTQALRRSTALTSRRFVLTFVVVALPVALEHQLLHALEVWIGFPFVVLLLVHVAAAVLVLVPVVLCEVTLAHRLTEQAGVSG